MAKRKKRSRKALGEEKTPAAYSPNPEKLAELTQRIKPAARLRIYAGYFFLLVLLVADLIARPYFGSGKSPTGLLYFLIGTAFIMAGSFQRFGAAGTLIKAARDGADELIMMGPYGRSRHPLYFGSFLNGVGFVFLAGPLGDLVPATRDIAWALTPWGIVLFIGILVPVYIWMIRIEEAFLAEKFGPLFEKYKHFVPCFTPTSGYFTRDPDWKFDPVRLAQNREKRNFTGLMIVYVLFFLKMLYFLAIEMASIHQL